MSGERIRTRDRIDRLVLLFNILAIICLLSSYLAGVFSPSTFWPLAFLGMGYPIILASIVLFCIYWILRRRWFLWLNLALVLVKWEYVPATINYSWNSDVDAGGIKVMSYNVRLFDRYNWSTDKNTRFRSQEFIFNQQPDILCIQEFFNRSGDKFRAIDTLLHSNRMRHVYTENYPSTRKSKNQLGLAILTAYPILNKGQITFANSTSAMAIYTDILIDRDTIRVYNLHLQSIHLGSKGYAVIDELMETQELEDVPGGKDVLRRMKAGFAKRAAQAEEIAAHIAACKFPVIVCGDFNDVPTSYTYQTIQQNLKDSFSQKGKGLGNTYVRVPFFRIDNILYSKSFEATGHKVHPYELSDHLAITATLYRK